MTIEPHNITKERGKQTLPLIKKDSMAPTEGSCQNTLKSESHPGCRTNYQFLAILGERNMFSTTTERGSASPDRAKPRANTNEASTKKLQAKMKTERWGYHV